MLRGIWIERSAARPITLIKHNTLEETGKTKEKDSSQVTYKKSEGKPLLKGAISFGVFVISVGLVTQTARASILGMFMPAGGVSEQLLVDDLNSQTLKLLESARNVDPNPSKGGGDIQLDDDRALVSETSPFSTSEDQVAPQTADQISLYMVQEGDTLSQVAQMFSVSVNTVIWANELSSSKDIHPGQTLLILPISGVQHVVKKGDTVAKIAKKYEGDVDEILAYNNLSGDESLVVGETITIPGGTIEEEAPATATYTKVATGGASVSGYFIHPLPGSVRTQGIHGYNGVDFGAPSGTPIRAAAAGKVIVSRVGGWNGGYGNYVVIDHPNGTQTLYAHNTRNAVWQGQSVVAGQVIGYVGSTGRSTGNHLHFEVRGAKNPF